MMARIAILTLAAVALGGCITVECREPQLYDDARTAPMLKAPEGLTVPEPDPAMRIPPGPTSKQDTHLRARSNGTCLDRPPKFDRPSEGEG